MPITWCGTVPRGEWILNNVRERKIIAQDRLDTLKNQKPVYKQIIFFRPVQKIKLEFAPIDMWRDESKIETKDYFELKDYIMREKLKGSNRIELYEAEFVSAHLLSLCHFYSHRDWRVCIVA